MSLRKLQLTFLFEHQQVLCIIVLLLRPSMAISLTYLIFVKSVLVLLSFTMYHTTAKLALVLLNASLLATLATPKLTVAIIVPPIKLLSPSMCISLNPKMNFPVPCSQVSSSCCLRQTTFQIFTTLHCLPVPLHPRSTALLTSMVLPLILSPCNWTAWTHLPMTLSPLVKHAALSTSHFGNMHLRRSLRPFVL